MDFTQQFPAVIDSTTLKDFKKCEQYFFNRHVLGKKLYFEERSIHLVAGGAWARGLEIARKSFYQENYSAEQSILLGQDALIEAYGPEREGEKKSRAKLLKMFPYYFDKWPLELEQGLVPIKDGIEWKFKVPIEGFKHPDTGEQLYYAGRSDLLGVMKGAESLFDFCDSVEEESTGEEFWGMDDKTMGSASKLWNWEYELDLQMLGYEWAARKCGIEVAGWMVRGAAFGKVTIDPLTDLKETRINYRQGLVDQWEKEMRLTVGRMLAAYESGSFSKNLAEGCKAYFTLCDYQPECSLSPQQQNFVIERWNPLEEAE